MKNKKLSLSFKNAYNGFKHALIHERNMRIHMIIMILMLLTGIVLGLDALRWAILMLVSAFVLAAELFNTAIENIVDMIVPHYSEKAKIIKDTAAAAVLMASIVAMVIGLLILSEPILHFVTRYI